MQAAGVLVGTLAELAACVQVGEHQLHGRDAEFGVYVHRNASAIICHGDGAIHVNADFYAGAEARQVFVNGIVQHLKYAVVQAAGIRVTNVHSRALTHRLKALQLVNLGGAVFLLSSGGGQFGFHGAVVVVAHTHYNIRPRASARKRALRHRAPESEKISSFFCISAARASRLRPWAGFRPRPICAAQIWHRTKKSLYRGEHIR